VYIFGHRMRTGVHVWGEWGKEGGTSRRAAVRSVPGVVSRLPSLVTILASLRLIKSSDENGRC
jgi:hypothetical protein